VSVAPLIWHILRGGEVDVARIISDQLRHIVLNGLAHKATKLGFPGFIMGLVHHQGVQIPEPCDEKIKGSLVQKTLFKSGEFYFLNRVKIRLIGSRFKKCL
jgi:hypothetical protein